MKYKLKQILERVGHTQNDLAEVLGITYQSLSIKMNGHKDFKQSEIFKIIHYYNLTPEEVMDIFFNIKDKYNDSDEDNN